MSSPLKNRNKNKNLTLDSSTTYQSIVSGDIGHTFGFTVPLYTDSFEGVKYSGVPS